MTTRHERAGHPVQVRPSPDTAASAVLGSLGKFGVLLSVTARAGGDTAQHGRQGAYEGNHYACEDDQVRHALIVVAPPRRRHASMVMSSG